MIIKPLMIDLSGNAQIWWSEVVWTTWRHFTGELRSIRDRYSPDTPELL